MRTLTFTLLLGAVASANAAVFNATFDEYSEGYFAPTLDSGGVHFDNLESNLPGGGQVFTIEASNPGDLGSSFTPPNVLGFLGYVPGTGTAFGRFKSMDITLASAGYEMKSISLDIYTFLLQAGGNTVTLAGYKNNALVDSVTYTPNTFVVDHEFLALSTDDYDKFTVFSAGSVDTGVVFANFDNVRIVANAVPEPMTLASLGLGVAALLRRRRSKV